MSLCGGLLTRLCDEATDAFGLKKLFEKDEHEKMEKDVTKLYQGFLHKDCRDHKVSLSMSNQVLHHLDDFNAIFGRFGWNFTGYSYYRDLTVDNPMDKNSWRRIHRGLYGHRICETTASTAENTQRFLDDMLDFVEQAKQQGRVEYNTKLLDVQPDDDINPEDDEVIHRPAPHLNKLAQ